MGATILASGARQRSRKLLYGLALAAGLALGGTGTAGAAPPAAHPPTAIAPVIQSAPTPSAATVVSHAVGPLSPAGRGAAVAMLVVLFAGLAGMTIAMWREVTRDEGPPRRR